MCIWASRLSASTPSSVMWYSNVLPGGHFWLTGFLMIGLLVRYPHLFSRAHMALTILMVNLRSWNSMYSDAVNHSLSTILERMEA